MRTPGAPVVLCIVASALLPLRSAAQAGMDHGDHTVEHPMLTVPIGDWTLLGMGQVFPVVTFGAPGASAGDPLRETGWYLTQPALMMNLESPSERLVLRTTLDFEGVTLDEGELTFGGWGEGFLDKRHPHTLLHEAMLSLNFFGTAGGDLSISAGKGFAPYGTDDPMSRPGLKYPTNHHLSQILERWTLNAVWLREGWSVEAGLFSGNEPEGPYDFSNYDGFGNSWSARLTRRWSADGSMDAGWELSGSYGRVTETHDGEDETTDLVNAALRRSGPAGPGALYALVEASQSDPEGEEDGFFSVLGELRYDVGRHRPYVRFEHATRPEYAREGPSTSEDFFRYDHDAEPVGATRWSITTLAYAAELTTAPASVQPFVEVQHHRVRAERGGIVPEALFGTGSFWSISVGARLFFGGGPMRMGSYGVLDPMTAMSRSMGGGMEMPMR